MTGPTTKPLDMEARATEILAMQAKAIASLAVTPAMIQAARTIAGAPAASARVITTGMGKAGIIATKMSATLASIGIPSFFMSPAEAAHGDLGRIAPGDIVIVFSNSGSTAEVVSTIQHLHLLNAQTNPIITVCGTSTPAVPTDIVVDYGEVVESCVVSKVPSTSTTVMLVIADVLAITAAESLGLDDAWFKARHPGGAIGVAYKEGR